MSGDDLLTRKRVNYARGYLELGLLREAAAELDAITGAQAARADVRSARVDLLMERKAWADVVDAASGLVREHPELEHAWIAWAYALRELNRIEEARAVLLTGESRHGGSSAVLHYNLACYDSLLGALASARLRLERACRMDKRFRVEGKRDPDLKALRDAGDWPE